MCRISGSVIDNTDIAVNYANVLLVKNDSIAQYEITDENGSFSLDAEQGNYMLQICQFGDTLFSTNIILDKDIDLGMIVGQHNTLKLHEVTVTARKKLIERKIDRLIFNVENSIVSAGGTALDVLNITPRVFVQNDQISMIGKSTMTVTINDRSLQISGNDLTNYLKSIPSENIQSIEIISNPPAKYEADGNSGIVNIRLKTAVAGTWNTSLFSSYKQAKYGRGNVGGRFTYQQNKLTILSSISYINGADGPLEKQTICYSDQTFYNENNKKEFYDGLSGQIGVDYQISKKVTIGTQYSGSLSNPDTKGVNIGTLTDLNNRLLQTMKTDLDRQLKNNYNTLNIHTVYNGLSGKKLTLDADYFNYKKEQNQLYATNNYDENNALVADSYSSINNIGKQKVENYSVKMDMNHPLEWANLNYGGKISFTTTNNHLQFYDLSLGERVYDASQSNEFRYIENNQSLYLSAEKDLNDKWNLQLGLRLEHTHTRGELLNISHPHNNQYTKLFPTFYLTYSPNDDHSFSLDYGKRIQRPKFSMLNPFRTYSNPYMSVEGNPFLEPSFMHNIELGYTFAGDLNTSFYYSKETNGYSLVTIMEPNSIRQTNTMLNFYTMNGYGANISYTFNKIRWLESYISGDMNYAVTHANHPSIPKETAGCGASLSASNSFVLNASRTLLGSLNLFYSFPNTYINTKNKSSFSTGAGLRYLMNKNLTFNLSLVDIFRTNTQRWRETNNGILMNRYNYSDARSATLTVSWRFGNNKINARDSKTGNTEEKKRAN